MVKKSLLLYICANFRVLSFLGHFAYVFFLKNPYPISEVISFGLCTQVVPSWLRYTKEKKKNGFLLTSNVKRPHNDESKS